MDDELFGLRVVGRGGLQRLNVAAVAGLGHRETAEQLEVDDLLHVGLVVAFGAQVFDGAAEQAPLHSGLDHQRQVRHREHLDHRDRRADVAGAAVLLAEAVVGDARRGDDLHLLRRPWCGRSPCSGCSAGGRLRSTVSRIRFFTSRQRPSKVLRRCSGSGGHVSTPYPTRNPSPCPSAALRQTVGRT